MKLVISTPLGMVPCILLHREGKYTSGVANLEVCSDERLDLLSLIGSQNETNLRTSRPRKNIIEFIPVRKLCGRHSQTFGEALT